MKKLYLLYIICIICILNISFILHIKYNNEIINLNKKRFITFINNNLKDDSKKLIILPHTELGDEIIMNGAIRYFCTIYKKVVLVSKDEYYDQVVFMYKNLDNLLIYNLKNTDNSLYSFNNVNVSRFLPIDKEITNLFKKYNITFIPMYLFRKAYNLTSYKLTSRYPTHFYDELNIDPNIRYTYFKIYRNYERENELYNKLIKIIGNKYIIIIDDESRNMIIDINKIKDKNIPIFKIGNNSKNSNIELNTITDKYVFNYIKILENAHEIHTIPSSMMHLIDQVNIKTNIFLYMSIRPNNTYLKNSNNWTII